MSQRPDNGGAARGAPVLGGWELPPLVYGFLEGLIRSQLLSTSSVLLFLRHHAGHLDRYTTTECLTADLIEAGLLTAYQVRRVMSGLTHGLLLGNHRVLEHLGGGAMGTVYLAEHVFMRRQVAIKVVPTDEDCPPEVVERFYAEMRVLAELRHPNVVTAYDAGRLPAPDPGMPALLYLAMELVLGGDLEKYVGEHGPAPIGRACDWVRQAACGLQEAHDHHLIHRDVKPSNLLLTEDGRVKLVDFGLARQFSSRLTGPRALLGTVQFMAPEQSEDSAAVGSQADIYGLGATLFWLLTGEPPHPKTRSVAEALRCLQHTPARRLSLLRPEVPPELDALIRRMLDTDPTRRPALAMTVAKALEPFCRPSPTSNPRLPTAPPAPPEEPDLAKQQTGVIEAGKEK